MRPQMRRRDRHPRRPEAAACWAGSALCATVASRSIGADSTIAWVMTIGLVLTAPLVLLFASLGELSARAVLLLATSGLMNVVGLAFEYRALRVGKVGVVSAVASTQGMAATLIAVAAGAALAPGVLVILVLLSAGVALAAADRNATLRDSRGDLRRLMALLLPLPLIFGLSLFAAGEAGDDVALAWAIVPSRLAGVLLIGFPLLARGTLRLERAVLPAVATSAVLEVVGFASYVWGSRSGLSIAAVLASQFAAIATAGAWVLFREHLDRRQLVGLAIIATGIGALAVFQG
jgi:uncharacterized membrane protein